MFCPLRAVVQSIHVVSQQMPLGKPIPDEKRPLWIYYAAAFLVLS
jgi:hypothetical protein